MGIGMVWGVLRQAAIRIPWSKVVQNAPLVVDVLDRMKAKVKLNEAAQRSLDDQLKTLTEENIRLSSEVLQVSLRLQQLTARVSVLSRLCLLAIVFSIATLVLWLAK